MIASLLALIVILMLVSRYTTTAGGVMTAWYMYTSAQKIFEMSGGITINLKMFNRIKYSVFVNVFAYLFFTMPLAYSIGFGVGAAVSLVVIIVSIATVSWLIVEERDEANGVNRTRQVGLFLVCSEESCEADDTYLHIAVQTLSLISTLAQIAGIICHIIKESKKKHPHLIYFIATLFSLAAAVMFTGMTIYSTIYHPRPEVSFGFSFALGWISFVASFVLAVIAVLRAIKDAETIKTGPKCVCC